MKRKVDCRFNDLNYKSNTLLKSKKEKRIEFSNNTINHNYIYMKYVFQCSISKTGFKFKIHTVKKVKLMKEFIRILESA